MTGEELKVAREGRDGFPIPFTTLRNCFSQYIWIVVNKDRNGLCRLTSRINHLFHESSGYALPDHSVVLYVQIRRGQNLLWFRACSLALYLVFTLCIR